MSTLQLQQQALQRSLLLSDEAQAAAASAGLLQASGFGLGAGLTIYRQAYRARLLAALSDNYTVLQRAMGDEAFAALALRYLQAHPSTQPSIRWFGEQLAGFMAEDDLPHPALVDIARMDWALRAAFDGPDAALLRPEHLATLAPEDWGPWVMALQPTVCLLPMSWAIEAAWRALRAYEPESGEAAPELPEPAASAHLLLIWRDAGLETRWRSLQAQEAQLLQALAQGETFAALGERLAQEVGAEAAAPQLLQYLVGWLNEGLLVSL